MKFLKKQYITSSCSAICLALTMIATSCDAVYDDLRPCVTEAELRFIYDYHMERGNAFMYNVDCLTVYIYDSDGKLVEKRVETGSCLADEDWRMRVELPGGDYHVVAYGGMECDKASFEHTGETPAIGSAESSLAVNLKSGLHEGAALGEPLHDHFWGEADLKINTDTDEVDKATVEMRKNTNNIRVVLQHLSGEPVDPDMFDFQLIADNTHMAADNSLVSRGETVYTPWAKGTTAIGLLPDGSELSNAYAQISTSRIVENPGANPRLRVTRADTKAIGRAGDSDNTVLDLDLIYLIKLARQQNNVNEMPLQEYLDRESRWSFIFLLDENNNYYSLRIKVNDWEVRINNIEGL